MNWLSRHVRPGIQALVGNKKETPDNLWTKCQACDQMLFHKALAENLQVCTHCGHHHRMGVHERLESLFDDGNYLRLELPEMPADPLKFKDKKPYIARLKEYQSKTAEKDAVIVARGNMGGRQVVVAAFYFAFMGGSMGRAVGEAPGRHSRGHAPTTVPGWKPGTTPSTTPPHCDPPPGDQRSVTR